MSKISRDDLHRIVQQAMIEDCTPTGRMYPAYGESVLRGALSALGIEIDAAPIGDAYTWRSQARLAREVDRRIHRIAPPAAGDAP